MKSYISNNKGTTKIEINNEMNYKFCVKNIFLSDYHGLMLSCKITTKVNL